MGIFIAMPSDTQAGGGVEWQPYTSQLLDEANSQDKPVIIDFYADWCIPCKELDKFTFSDPKVIKFSKNFITLKADLTTFQSEETIALREKFNIKGVPTILFLDTDGQEFSSLRLMGYEDTDLFLSRMEKAGK
jgi:thiol:disulfide interchange protein DsbD